MANKHYSNGSKADAALFAIIEQAWKGSKEAFDPADFPNWLAPHRVRWWVEVH